MTKASAVAQNYVKLTDCSDYPEFGEVYIKTEESLTGIVFNTLGQVKNFDRKIYLKKCFLANINTIIRT